MTMLKHLLKELFFSEKLTNQRNAASEDQELYSDETQKLLFIKAIIAAVRIF